MKITLPSGKMIGEDEPCFVIAEVGSNWKTLDDCLMSIRAAKVSGADAVKYQFYDSHALYGISSNVSGILSPHWFPALKREANQVGIEFMCSAFSPALIEMIDPYVSLHKVASAECNHLRMLEKLKLIGKPVLLSTGAHGDWDIEKAVAVLGNTPKVLLYCVASYPAKVIHLGGVSYLKDKYGCLVGYSDHSLDALIVPSAAFKQGACVIEKHVNFTEHTNTPDAPHSLSQREFELMVKMIRGNYSYSPGYTSEEKPMVLRHNRRLIAIQPIQEGDTLIEGKNFGIYRSMKEDTHGYHPFLAKGVHGKIARRNKEVGDSIGPGDI